MRVSITGSLRESATAVAVRQASSPRAVRAHRRLPARSWPLLVLVVLAALLGAPAVASASDQGLRTLVTEQRAAEKAFEKEIKNQPDAFAGLGRSPSAAQVARRASLAFRRLANVLRREKRSYEAFGSRFAAEAPETNEATVGRTLMVRGLRDAEVSAARAEAITRRFSVRVLRVRSPAGFRRIGRQYDRAFRAFEKRADRAEKRLKRGRTLIRTAPPVPPPAPAA